jgi:hypothetical protein
MLSNWAEIPLFLQLQHEKCKVTMTSQLGTPEAVTSPDQKLNSSSAEYKGLFQDISGGFDFLVSFFYHCFF